MKNIIAYIVAALLILAVFEMPSGYYTFLRIAVLIGGGVLAFQEFQNNGVNSWVILIGLVTILFNPIFPIYLYNKAIWIPLDLISAAVFGIYGYKQATD